MYNKQIVVIDISNDNFFVITDQIKSIQENRRLLFSLKRLNAVLSETEIKVPFILENKIIVLQEIKLLFEKFEYSTTLSNAVQGEVINFNREETMFEEFRKKAFSIRNDEFSQFPELIDDFINFKSALANSFKRSLYLLQELSAFHLAFSQNACNFAVPGAGKTSIVYAAYAYLKSLPIDNPKHVDKLLVIGPLSSFAPWENEYLECFGTKTTFQRLSGDLSITKEEKLQHLYSGRPAEVTLVFHGGVDSLQNDIIEFLKKNKTMVVVDEAHRIKNPEGVWGQSITTISKEAVSRVVLTGTPVPNGYQDLFNLYKFIYPFKYKDILGFHYQNLIDLTNNSFADSERVLALKDNISPFFIRIKKKDLNLPPIEEEVVAVEMDKEQRAIYDYIETEYVKSFKKNDSATVKEILNKAKLIRLRQAASNPSLLAKTLRDSMANNRDGDEFDPNSNFTNLSDEFVDDSEFFSKICGYNKEFVPKKFEEIKRLIEDKILSNNGKVIIWTIFIQNAKELQEYLRKHNIASKLLIGEVLQVDREETISKFNDPNNSEFQVVIANPFAVSESISLHKGCHNAIYLERDYNCSNFLQSKDRIHRVGLEKGQVTNYYYMIAKDSIDEIIEERLKIKIERMEKIINDDIPLFSRLNDDDETDIIKEIIRRYAART